jgi:hypothetical protein
MQMNERFIILTAAAALSIAPLSGCTSSNVITVPQRGTSMRSADVSLSRDPMPINYSVKGPLTTSLNVKAKPKSPILFVTDAGTHEAYMFDVTTLALTGTITGFVQPQGECSDNKGNVWITDAQAQTTYEVSHEGRLENELSANGYPVSCAWDPTTGNLAVTDQIGASGGGGYVAIYKTGSAPISYSIPKVYYYNFVGYDASGNLFVDGRTTRGVFALMEMPKGTAKIQIVKVKGGKIYYPGMVQWDASASDLIVGDQSCGNVYSSCLHTLTLSKASATISSTVKLQNSSGGTICDLVQGDVYDGQLFGSDYDFCGSLPSTTYVWSYPAGGAPTLSNAKTDTSPVGAVVSP